MKFILPALVVVVLLSLYLLIADQEQPAVKQSLSTPKTSTQVELVPAEPSGIASLPKQSLAETPAQETTITTEELETKEIDPEVATPESTENENPLSFNLDQSTHFLILGNTATETAQMNFKSELLPSNEVQLSIQLEQQDSEKVELKAYFDLANFTMELDGGNSILNKEHKKLLKESGEALQSAIWEQYAEYDIPEHALMLTQMLAYWSVSPEGFVHEKRVIVSQ